MAINLLDTPPEIGNVRTADYVEFNNMCISTNRSTYDNLDTHTHYARRAIEIIHLTYPNVDNAQEIYLQWRMDRISDVKQLLTTSIAVKQTYYENTIFGIITKLFLQLFCLWNDGNTPCIQRAVDLLMEYDSERPVIIGIGGQRFSIQDFPMQGTDTTNFFNYRA